MHQPRRPLRSVVIVLLLGHLPACESGARRAGLSTADAAAGADTTAAPETARAADALAAPDAEPDRARDAGPALDAAVALDLAVPPDAAGGLDLGPDGPSDAGGLPRSWQACGQYGMGRPTQAVLSADGGTVALLYAGGALVLQRVEDFAVIRTFPFARKEVSRVVLAPDGSLVALSLPSGLRVLRVSDGSVVLEGSVKLRPQMFSPDGRQLLLVAMTVDTGPPQVWDLATGTMVREHAVEASHAIFTDEGRAVVAHSTRRVTTFPAKGPPIAVEVPFSYGQFSPRGDLVIGVRDESYYNTTSAHRVADGKHLWTTSLELSLPVDFVFSADQAVLLGIQEEAAWALDPKTGKGRRLALARPPAITAVAVGPAGGPVIVSDSAGVRRTTIEALEGGVDLASAVAGQPQPIMGLAVSPDGRRLATSAYEGRDNVTIWDLPAKTVLRTIHTDVPTAGVSFSPDGQTLLRSLLGIEEYAAAEDGPARAVAAVGIDPSRIRLATYSPDGRRIAFGHGSEVRVVDRATFAPVAVLPTGSTSPGFAFSPDGRTIAVSGPQLFTVDGARLWSAPPTGQQADRFDDHSVAFSPDGATIVESRIMASFSQPPYLDRAGRPYTSTRLFDAATGAPKPGIGIPFPRRPSFSPDGAWLLAGDRLWSIPQSRTQRLPGQRAILVSTFLPDGRIAAGLASGEVLLYCAE